MITATIEDESIVVDILTSSFETNQSVNYIIKQDIHKKKRLRVLMEYSFYLCLRFGKVFLSENKKACALILYPDKQKTTFTSIFWDVKLALVSIGRRNLIKALKRESQIKKRHPAVPFVYLWFIGVTPEEQHKGIGSQLLQDVLEYTDALKRGVYLETSTVINLPWYEKFGFQNYDELDLGYRLFFFKRA